MFSMLNVHEDLKAGICRECLSAQKRTQTTGGLQLGCDVYEVFMVPGVLETLFQLQILYKIEWFGIGVFRLWVGKDLYGDSAYFKELPLYLYCLTVHFIPLC
jgi:hypothetical protein